MKLLFIGYMQGFGGAERMLITLANAMAERNHDVYLVSLASNELNYGILNNVAYKFIPDYGTNKLSRIKNRYLKLKTYIEEINPELIISFWLQPAYFCAFMGKGIAQKTIYAERGDPFDSEYNGVVGIIRRFCFKRLRGFVFQSKNAQSCFGSDVRCRSCVIQNPVFLKENTNNYVPTARDRRIVNIGRLCEQKNHELLIDAFAMLSDEANAYSLEIYGDGPLKERLQDKINELGLSDRVFLKGTFSNIHRRIANARMFVLSSDYEGMPNALLEAMALGLPCISTNYSPGGVGEIIANGVNGLITPCGDAAALVSALKTLLMDEDLSERIGKCAREVRIKFAPQHIFDEWEQFFFNMAVKNENKRA